MLYGQIGNVSKKRGIEWGKRLFTPVHAFTTEKDGLSTRAVSLCGLVKAVNHGNYMTWIVRLEVYMKQTNLHHFNERPCYYCKKRHKETLVAEVMMEGEK